MINDVVEIIQQLLDGGSYDSFIQVTSNSDYLDPCRSIVENNSFDISIRFNACKIIYNLIKRFGFTSWPREIFEELDIWFLSLINYDDIPNSSMNNLLRNKTLFKQIGNTYACLMLCYCQCEESNFIDFWPRVEPILNKSKSCLITGFYFLTGMCEFFADHSDFPNSTENMINKALSICLSNCINSNDFILIQSTLELMNSILLIYLSDKSTTKYNIKHYIINCPKNIMEKIEIPEFIQLSLLNFYIQINDANVNILCLDILYNITSIPVCFLSNVSNFYANILIDLIEIMKSILNNGTFSSIEWQYIDYICLITNKVNFNLNFDYVKNIQCYPSYLNLFVNLSMKIIYQFENNEVFTDSINNFFSNTQIFSNCLSFWHYLFQFFPNMKTELKLTIYHSTTDIVLKCIDFLFNAINQDSESTFNSLEENKFQFDFIVSLIDTTELNIIFFCNHFADLFSKIFERYLKDRYSINNELDLCLILSMCSQFLIKYSDIESSIYYNYIFTSNEGEETQKNEEEDKKEIIKTNPFEKKYFTWFSDDEKDNFHFSRPKPNHNSQINQKINFYEIEKAIIDQIYHLINETNDENSIKNYCEFHQNSSTSTFLENSILNFIYGFKMMIFNKDSFYLKGNDEFKKRMTSLIVSRICNDTKFYSLIHFDFYTNILFRVKSILSFYSDNDRSKSFLSNQEYLNQLLSLSTFITDMEIRKSFCYSLFSASVSKDLFKSEIIPYYSNQFERYVSNFKTISQSQEDMIKFTSLLIDYSSLFECSCLSGVNDDKNGYRIIFESIFPKYFNFFESNSVLLFANKDLTPYTLLFWHSVVKWKSSIHFKKHSDYGILLFETSLNILSSFFTNFQKYANNENIGNYLECLTKSLTIFNCLLEANYVSFKTLIIYNDKNFITAIDFILNSLMKFSLKNMFEFVELGQQLNSLAVLLFEKHSMFVFSLQNNLLIQFLVHILEISIFAPNLNIALKSTYDTIEHLVYFLNSKKENEKFDELIFLLTNDLEKIFIEIWQLFFRKENDFDIYKKIIKSFLAFYQGFPIHIREIILSGIPDSFKDPFNANFELISQSSDVFDKTIKTIHDIVTENLHFDISFINCFPINWNEK